MNPNLMVLVKAHVEDEEREKQFDRQMKLMGMEKDPIKHGAALGDDWAAGQEVDQKPKVSY